MHGDGSAADQSGFCDHGEQMIPPVKALGHEYVGVMHRPRSNEPGIWRVIGAIDGTVLSWSSDVGGPATIDQGDDVEFITADPFVVTSQDADHPFIVLAHMSGSSWDMLDNSSAGLGDPDTVLITTPAQYMRRYVFFADVSYSETNLVVVRKKSGNNFADVQIDCAGVLDGWQPLGDYEWTRFDLVTGNFQPNGNCNTGRREMTSAAPFGLWIWGWGATGTTPATHNVSYGYPAGMNVESISDVFIPSVPK